MQATQQFNPMQVIMAIRNGQNPQQIVMNMLQERMSQTPMGQNLIALAQQNNVHLYRANINGEKIDIEMLLSVQE